MTKTGFRADDRTSIVVEGPFERVAQIDQIGAFAMITIEGRSDPYRKKVTIDETEDSIRLPGKRDDSFRGDRECEEARALMALRWLAKCRREDLKSTRVLVTIPRPPEGAEKWTIEAVRRFVRDELADYDIESEERRWEARRK